LKELAPWRREYQVLGMDASVTMTRVVCPMREVSTRFPSMTLKSEGVPAFLVEDVK
jgi:hypothetical protein